MVVRGTVAPVATGADRTTEHWAQEASQAFLESSPDAVVVIDASGRIILVNAQTESMFGHPRDTLVGQSVEALLPERFRDAHTGHRGRYRAEPGSRPMGAGLDLFGQRADGTEFPIDISLAPLDTEEGRLLAATIRDVTERRQLEAARDQFIHHAAHELRTPLATLAALGETLALHLDEMPPDTIAEALGALKRQGERANNLVANLLDLSQLRSGHAEVRLVPLELSATLARVIEGTPPPDGTTVIIEVATDLVVIGDGVRLERVITNLLTNAYRYGGNLVVVTAARVDRGEVVLRVSDDGDGVPPDLADTIFEPFVRGKTAGAVGGSGIGLAICRRIMDALGGSIWYGVHDGRPTFSIRLRAGG
jgi:PAS domain S-box-containing protein